MGVAAKCVGDILATTKLIDPGYGDKPVLEATGDSIECRIDTLSTSQTRVTSRPENVRTHRSYHAADPELQSGMIVMWMKTGSKSAKPIEFAAPLALEVQGVGHEGRPGQTPKLWWVEYRQSTAEAYEEI